MRWVGRRHRDERGAVIVMMTIFSVVLVTLAAFAVDLGMQRVARRDMQALADAVALDLARLVDGRQAQQIVDGSARVLGIEAAKTASEVRNEGSALGEDPTVNWTLVDLDHKGDPVKDGSGDVVPVTGSDVPDAVYVTANTSVDFGFSTGSGGATRAALGVSSSAACFQLGSYAASISPSASPLFKDLLAPILGSSTLNLVGYNGLASGKISLLDLINAPSIGVGTVDELLALPNLTAGNLFLAAAHALTGRGLLAEAAVFNSAATSVVAPIVLNFGDILAVDGASDAVLSTHFNALDLLVGTAFLANGENLLNIPNLQAKLGSVAVTDTRLKIIEKARRWCKGDQGEGPETSQLSFQSTIKVETDNSPLLQTAKTKLRLVDASTGQPDNGISLSLNADLAGARAVLTDTSCDPDTFDVDVWTSLLTASLTGEAHVGGDIYGTVDLGIAEAAIAVPVQFEVTVSASAFEPAATEPEHVQLSYPPLNYGDHVSVGSGDVVLPDLSVTMAAGTLEIEPVTATVKIGGINVTVPVSLGLLEGVVNPVITNLLSPTGALVTRFEPIVQPLVDKINEILVQLNEALGINLGGADVYGMERPTCDAPELRG